MSQRQGFFSGSTSLGGVTQSQNDLRLPVVVWSDKTEWVRIKREGIDENEVELILILSWILGYTCRYCGSEEKLKEEIRKLPLSIDRKVSKLWKPWNFMGFLPEMRSSHQTVRLLVSFLNLYNLSNILYMPCVPDYWVSSTMHWDSWQQLGQKSCFQWWVSNVT